MEVMCKTGLRQITSEEKKGTEEEKKGSASTPHEVPSNLSAVDAPMYIILGRIACMLCTDAACCCRCSVVCFSVAIVSPTNSDEPTEAPFAVWTRMGPGIMWGPGMEFPWGNGLVLGTSTS